MICDECETVFHCSKKGCITLLKIGDKIPIKVELGKQPTQFLTIQMVDNGKWVVAWERVEYPFSYFSFKETKTLEEANCIVNAILENRLQIENLE